MCEVHGGRVARAEAALAAARQDASLAEEADKIKVTKLNKKS